MIRPAQGDCGRASWRMAPASSS